MGELEKDLDLSFILDAGDLIKVAFSLHQVTLYFERMKIQVFYRCEVRSPDQSSSPWEPKRVNDMTGFAKLLETKICDRRILSSKELLLAFDNGRELVLKCDEGDHESFVIEDPDGLLVVPTAQLAGFRKLLQSEVDDLLKPIGYERWERSRIARLVEGTARSPVEAFVKLALENQVSAAEHIRDCDRCRRLFATMYETILQHGPGNPFIICWEVTKGVLPELRQCPDWPEGV